MHALDQSEAWKSRPIAINKILWGGGQIPYIGIEPEKYTKQRRSKIIQFKTIKSIFKFHSIFIFKTYPPFVILGQLGRETLNQNTAALPTEQRFFLPFHHKLQMTKLFHTTLKKRNPPLDVLAAYDLRFS